MQAPNQVDVEVAEPPTDTISDIAFSPQADFLAAASWDNNVRIYQIGPDGNAEPRAMYSHEGPVFSCTWSRDGSKLVSAGADNTGRMMDVATGQSQVVAAHASPIRCAKFFDANGPPILVTGSWDKTVKYWDLRTLNPVGSVTVTERVYAMDALFPALVIGTADRHIQVIDLNNSNAVMQTKNSPLKWQTRSIACFRPSGGNGAGYAVGSIEGRVAVNYLDQKDTKESFTFRCHRDTNQAVYNVNSIAFHPIYNALCTAGSDGTFCYWDKDARSRLKIFDNVGGPITAAAFDRTGRVYAYGVGYDWLNGDQGLQTAAPTRLCLHAVREEEVLPKPTEAK